MFAFGVISLAISLIALIYSQPYAVYYPLLLVGILCVTLPPLSFYTGIKQRYEQIELRKMHAMDMR
jgi:O-antigen/teichoic acid export membrane protein